MTPSVTVIGGGTMGSGIAYVAAQKGGHVTLVEPDDVQYETCLRTIAQACESGIKRGTLNRRDANELKNRIVRVSKTIGLPGKLDIVIESVPERLELKRTILGDMATRQPALLATNTSALSVDELAAGLANPERFLGMHFFNPVWSIGVVELVRGRATSESALDSAQRFVTWLDKEFLTVRDVPGFATSRLDLAASLEAMRMLENGVTSAHEIDRAAVLAYRHPIGPLELSDLVGLDVRLDIARTLEKAHGPRFAPPEILVDLVARGLLGKKTGQGFFTWDEC